MNKKELIEQLEKYPDDLEIMIVDDQYWFVGSDGDTHIVEKITNAFYKADGEYTTSENDGANRPIILLS